MVKLRLLGLKHPKKKITQIGVLDTETDSIKFHDGTIIKNEESIKKDKKGKKRS